MCINTNHLSTDRESNPFVQWFRSQNLPNGKSIPSEVELAKKLNLNKTLVNHGLNYLWNTNELLWNAKGMYVREGKVKYVKNDGWYLNGKLIQKV